MSEAQKIDDVTYRLWDVVERSGGGYERRRRFARRMTEKQAREWEAAFGGNLDGVDEFAAPSDATELPARCARSVK